MKMTVNIPKELLEEAMNASGIASKTMVVIMGLRARIKKKRLEKLAELQGSDAIRLSAAELKTQRSR